MLQNISKGQSSIPLRYIIQGLEGDYNTLKTNIHIAHVNKQGGKATVYFKVPSVSVPRLQYDCVFEFSDDEAECLKNEIIFSKAVKEIKDRLKDPEYPTAKKKLISGFKFTKINGKNKGLEKKTFDEMRFPNVEFFPLIQIHNNERKEVLKYDDDFEVPLIVKFIEDFIIKQLIPIDLGDL